MEECKTVKIRVQAYFSKVENFKPLKMRKLKTYSQNFNETLRYLRPFGFFRLPCGHLLKLSSNILSLLMPSQKKLSL
jgi:hypothetical protein